MCSINVKYELIMFSLVEKDCIVVYICEQMQLTTKLTKLTTKFMRLLLKPHSEDKHSQLIIINNKI